MHGSGSFMLLKSSSSGSLSDLSHRPRRGSLVLPFSRLNCASPTPSSPRGGGIHPSPLGVTHAVSHAQQPTQAVEGGNSNIVPFLNQPLRVAMNHPVESEMQLEPNRSQACELGWATTFAEEYELGAELGSGNFGIVYQATRKCAADSLPVFEAAEFSTLDPEQLNSVGVLDTLEIISDLPTPGCPIDCITMRRVSGDATQPEVVAVKKIPKIRSGSTRCEQLQKIKKEVSYRQEELTPLFSTQPCCWDSMTLITS